MADETYTNDGETEYELVYDVPEDAGDDYTVWLESDDDKVGVDLAEFEAEWTECDYDFYLAQETNEQVNKWDNARARNGFGIN